MQAAENAQVLQKRNASPSSAMGELDDSRITLPRRRGRGAVQVVVETHGDDTQQQPAPRGGRDALRVVFDQSIADQRFETQERVAEVRPEIDVVALLDRSDVHESEAHELLDDVGA